MSESEKSARGLRTPGEYGLAGMTVLATVAFAVLFVFGLPAAAAWQLSRNGVTAYTVVLTALAALWVGILLFGVARDRETRGWIVFAFVGWLVLPLSAIVHRLRRRSS